jgi:alpha-glucosidase
VFGGSAWQWDARRRQYYLHSFLAEQPDLNFHCPTCSRRCWARCASGASAAWTASASTPATTSSTTRLLRDNPPATLASIDEVSTVRADNPYAMQQHLYDKSQPENLAFLERLRRCSTDTARWRWARSATRTRRP